jgi:hypothetical protein
MRSWKPRENHLSASPPGKSATSHRASLTVFAGVSPKLPHLNKTLLKAILMINKIVTCVARNIWYYGGKSIAE